MSNNLPDIYYNEDINAPILISPNSAFELPMYQTLDSMMDVESYKNFIDNAINRFRRSRSYKHYKAYLIELGLDKSQFLGNITSEMLDKKLELNHTILTIFDIALIICEHMLHTVGKITTFDLVMLLKKEHRANHIPLTMLDVTTHQLYHNSDEFFIHPNMVFGDWITFLKLYNKGLTQDIAFKLLFYIKRAIDEGKSTDANLLDLRERLIDWSNHNK